MKRTVWTCDKCGNEYDGKTPITIMLAGEWVEVQEANISYSILYKNSSNSIPKRSRRHIDLCPRCRREFFSLVCNCKTAEELQIDSI